MQADVLVGQRLAQRDLSLARQRMADRHGEHQAVGAEVQHLQSLGAYRPGDDAHVGAAVEHATDDVAAQPFLPVNAYAGALGEKARQHTSEEHTSELQATMRTTYADI